MAALNILDYLSKCAFVFMFQALPRSIPVFMNFISVVVYPNFIYLCFSIP